MCASGPRTKKYPDILGGHAEISWRSAEQVARLLVQTPEKYVEECRAFMSGLDEGECTRDRVRSRVSITASDLPFFEIDEKCEPAAQQQIGRRFGDAGRYGIDGNIIEARVLIGTV